MIRNPRGWHVRRGLCRRFVNANRRIWDLLPSSIKATRTVKRYGAYLHSLVQRYADRRQFYGTYFLRNRAEIELIRKLAGELPRGSDLKLTVAGCSNGAEVYSIVWAIRRSRPDLNLIVEALEISGEILEVAKGALYGVGSNEFMDGVAIFERLTDEEFHELFEVEHEEVKVKPWIREGISFRIADAADPSLLNVIGPQHMVVANRFLCHMTPADAKNCLCNLATLLEPNGYLFVSGVDLDVRTQVARDLGWIPVPDLMEEIHDGDPSIRRDWPWKWWGLEPFDRSRADWDVRYASTFRVTGPAKGRVRPEAEQPSEVAIHTG